MSRTARLFRLMQELRRLDPPVTAEVLAQELQVTPRTVYRDVDELRGLGVIIDGAAGFGYCLIEDNTLPPQAFGTEEYEAILLGLSEVRARADPALVRAAESATVKLRGRLTDRQRERLVDDVMASRRFRPEPTIKVDEERLRKAIRGEWRVVLKYRDGAGVESQRKVDPLNILYLDEVRCLLAYCHLRRDYRAFRVDRIATLDILSESFRPRRRGMLREFRAKLRAENRAMSRPEASD